MVVKTVATVYPRPARSELPGIRMVGDFDISKLLVLYEVLAVTPTGWPGVVPVVGGRAIYNVQVSAVVAGGDARATPVVTTVAYPRPMVDREKEMRIPGMDGTAPELTPRMAPGASKPTGKL